MRAKPSEMEINIYKIRSMDFDKPKVYGDTSITDGLVKLAAVQILCKLLYQVAKTGLGSEILSFCKLQIQIKYIMDSLINV